MKLLLLIALVQAYIPQARQEGWRWKIEYPKYYTPVKLTRVLRVVIATAEEVKDDPIFILAIAIQQSRLQSDAVGKNRNGTRDYGLFQLNSRYYQHPKKFLFIPENNGKLFSAWFISRRAFCRRAKTKRCKLNKRRHGRWLPLFHSKKTRKIYQALKELEGANE